MVMKWMPGHALGEQLLGTASVATSTPSARTRLGVVGDRVQPVGQIVGEAWPDRSTNRVICRALVTGMTPAMIGTSQPCALTRSRSSQVVAPREEHLGDREVGPGPALGHEDLDVPVDVGRPRVQLGERGHPDAEVAHRAGSARPARSRSQALGVAHPRPAGPPGRVAAERQRCAPGRGGRADHVPQLGHAWSTPVRCASGVIVVSLRRSARSPHGALAGRPAGAVGHRHERGLSDSSSRSAVHSWRSWSASRGGRTRTTTSGARRRGARARSARAPTGGVAPVRQRRRPRHGDHDMFGPGLGPRLVPVATAAALPPGTGPHTVPAPRPRLGPPSAPR